MAFCVTQALLEKTYANNMEPSKEPTSTKEEVKQASASQVIFSLIIGVAVFYGLTSYLTSSGSSSSSTTSTVSNTTSQPEEVTTTTAPQPMEYKLELVSQNCSREHGYLIVSGEVKNISDTPLNNVEVVAAARGEDGTQISSNSSLIEYTPILAGQTSPFKAYIRYNPAMITCGVLNFKELMGGTIPTTQN